MSDTMESPAKRKKTGPEGFDYALSMGILGKTNRPNISNRPSCVQKPDEERNVFSEFEKLRTSISAASTTTSEQCYMPRAIPNVSQDPQLYMDSMIQPSPKDSGVDMSSPERKLDDLCDSSSQECSPLVSAHSDNDKDCVKSIPKYAAIGCIAAGMPVDVYMNENDKRCDLLGSLDSNMNSTHRTKDSLCHIDNCSSNSLASFPSHTGQTFGTSTGHGICGHDSGNESGQEVAFVSVNDSDDDHGLLDSGDVIVAPSSPSGRHSINSCAVQDLPDLFTPVAGSSHPQSIDTPYDEENVVGDNCDMFGNDECTLAELNMSQKSIETDLDVLLRKQSSPGKGLHQSLSQESIDSNYELYNSEENIDSCGLFSTLKEGSLCSFSVCGTPTKTLQLTPQGTPFRKIDTTSVHTEKSAGPIHVPIPSGSSYLSEFAKFLQKTSCQRSIEAQDDIDDMDVTVDESPKLSKPACTQSPRPLNKEPKTLVVEEHDTVEQASNAVLTDTPKATAVAAKRCLCCVKRNKTKLSKFNAKHFVKNQKKITQLREFVVELLRTLFPEIDYKSHKQRTLNNVDVLLDQIMACVKARKHPKHLAVIPTEDSILDVRIIVCKSPQHCMKHLRRKICRLLVTLLPELDLSWPFDQTGDDVEDLMQEVIRCNSS